MKKTLVISGHPRISSSTANRLILEKLIAEPNVTVVDIKTNYPDDNINVPYEQQLLREASLIVWQFPFVWYGVPSHFKAWMEKVFTEGFAYGKNGNALKNKKLLLSITLGSSCGAYTPVGQHRNPVESFLTSLEIFIAYCGMEYLPPVYSYAMVANSSDDMDQLQVKVTQHANRVLNIMRQHEAGELKVPLQIHREE